MSVVRPMSRLGTLAFKVPIKVPALGTVKAAATHAGAPWFNYCRDQKPFGLASMVILIG